MSDRDTSSLGQTFRAARQNKRLKLAEVAERTRIPLDRLQALEADRYGDLPDDVYLKGAIRNYALFLGLDPNEVLAIYRTARPAQLKRAPLSVAPTTRTIAVVPAVMSAVVIAVLILVALVLLHVIIL